MGPSILQCPTSFSPRQTRLGLSIVFALLLTLSVHGQAPNFDFGDGRHGSFTLPAGETTIQDLWSQVRLGTDTTAYDPSVETQVPSLENLTLSNGATLSVSAFAGNPNSAVDPKQGGVLRLKVRGTLTIAAGATISVTGRGYRGGTLEGDPPGRIGQQGDSWGSGGGISGEANRGGGGGGFGEINNNAMPGAGGGGGHREAGSRGTTGSGSETGGLGGAAFDTVATGLGQSFRDTYSFPRFGSGGGRGGQVENSVNINADGGRGGGVLIIEAARIVNNGSIVANGATGGSNLSAGGGGAGGSIWIQSLSEENGTVSVAGGIGGVGTVLGNDGGAGSPGIQLWDARFQLTSAVDGQGAVSVSPAGNLYDPDSTVEVMAIPETGWAFDHWEGDLTGSVNPSNLVMNGDKSVTAFFVELPTLTVSPTTVDVGPSATNLTFNVGVAGTDEDVNWTTTVNTGGTFVSISAGESGTNAGTITVAVGASNLAEARSATLTVASDDVGSEPVVLTINQSPAEPLLEVVPATNTVGANGEELVVQVRNVGTGSFDWTASMLTGTAFATITSGGTGTNSGTFVVTFTENSTPLQRTATIAVEAPGVSNSPVEIRIVQQAGLPLLQVSPASQLIGSAAGTASLSVTNGGNGTLNWTAAVVSGGAFATVTAGSSGTDSGLITIAFTDNSGMADRTATVSVESSDAANSPVQVTITQTAQEAVLQVTPETQRVGSSAASVSFQVLNGGTGSMNWTASVSEGANFVTITDGSAGTNNGVITASVTQNPSTIERLATILVQAPGAANSPRTVNIVQSPRSPVLRVLPAEQFVGSVGGTVSVTVENGGEGALDWTASVVSGADFLSLTAPSNGSGNGVVQVVVAPNATEEDRVGTVRIEALGAVDSPQIATITQLGCVLLNPPTNLTASDGLFPDVVQVIWSARFGATSYEVFRAPSSDPEQIEFMGATIEPQYTDMRADPPEYELVNNGCLNPGEFRITNVLYFYYVKAVNDCGASALSAGTTGHRGLPLAESEAKTYRETILPNRLSADGSYLLAGEGEVSIRMTNAAGIDVNSLWVELAEVALAPDAITWVPLDDDRRDGWVIVQVPAHYLPGDYFVARAGGTSLDGADLTPAGALFQLGDSALKADGSGVEIRPMLLDDETSGQFLEGLGSVFEIAPRIVFETPQQVWIPLPEGADSSLLEVYYYGEDANGGVWYPASDVIGLLADSTLALSEDGTSVGVWVNHGGTVRLGKVTQAVPTAAALAPNNTGTILVIVLTCLLLLGARRRVTD